MSLPLQPRLGRRCGFALLAALAWPAARADPPADTVKQVAANADAALANFIDRLPDLIDLGLPAFAPRGAINFYAHPKFGDILHEDYFRLPLGARYKVSDQLELNTELGTYFTHGFGHDAGQGLYELQLGFKQEVELSANTGASVGLDFVTPLSRPPFGITDGLRHTLPYVTLTRSLWPRWDIVVFSTFGADLIDHTAIPPDFRTNELRADALTLTLGAAREWRHMHVILKLIDSNSDLLSRTRENAFGLWPSVGIPLLRRSDGTPRMTATFEGRLVWGPDGTETGITTSVRFDLRYRQDRSIELP